MFHVYPGPVSLKRPVSESALLNVLQGWLPAAEFKLCLSSQMKEGLA